MVEDVGKLQLVFVARDVADVRRRDHVFKPEQGVVDVAQRLLLEHVYRGHGGPAGAQSRLERAGFDQARAAGVDENRGGFHERQVGGGHDAARVLDQAHMQ